MLSCGVGQLHAPAEMPVGQQACMHQLPQLQVHSLTLLSELDAAAMWALQNVVFAIQTRWLDAVLGSTVRWQPHCFVMFLIKRCTIPLRTPV